MIVWNDIHRKLETLKLLSELVSKDIWKSITQLVHRFELNSPARKKRNKSESEPVVENPKGEDVYEEIIYLPREAGYELIELLESKNRFSPKWKSTKRNVLKRHRDECMIS